MAKANREMEEDYIGDSEAKSGKRMAAEQVASLLKWEIADVYVKRYFDGEERIAVWEMANTLIREYEAMRREEDWITDSTKEKAIHELKKIRVRAGMPANAAEYLSGYCPKKEEGKSYLAHALAVKKAELQRKNARLDRPIDRSLWEMHPQEMTPCYYPISNAIYIPVAALEAPFFSVKASREENLGGNRDYSGP